MELPSLQFYPGDRLKELMPVLADNEAVGAWCKAWMYLWGAGPSTAEVLEQVVGKAWVKVAFLFDDNEGLFSLEWMEKKRAETIAFREKQARNGRQGGRGKRKAGKGINPSLSSGLSHSKAKKSPRVEGEEEENSSSGKERANDFDTWWTLYERKGSRKLSAEQWAKLSEPDREACIAATPAYVASKPDKQFRKDGERYLKHRTWEDEVVVPTLNGTPVVKAYGKDDYDADMRRIRQQLGIPDGGFVAYEQMTREMLIFKGLMKV